VADTEYRDVLYETKGRLAIVTLNRPEKMNALSHRLRGELFDALKTAEANPDVRVIIVRGAGRTFSAGYDLSGANATDDPSAYVDTRFGLPNVGPVHPGQAQWANHLLSGYWQIWELAKPVIAQVHGYCLAGGTDIALLCDMVIAADDAQIGFPPVRAMGSPVAHMWTYLAGPQWAKRMLLTGDSLSGAEAARIGLVLEAVPASQLADTVEALADKLAMIDIDLLAANKRICNIALEMMGARTVQRMAAEMDGRAHLAPSVAEFGRRSRENGLKAALEWRDSKFGDGRASAAAQARKTAVT
jgi:enoyl-CoA hydratase